MARFVDHDTRERSAVWVPTCVSARARVAFEEALERGVDLRCAYCGSVIAGPVGTTVRGRPVHYNLCLEGVDGAGGVVYPADTT